MVELLPLEKAEDIELVRGLLEEFAIATGSNVAKKTLADWNNSCAKFVKVSVKSKCYSI